MAEIGLIADFNEFHQYVSLASLQAPSPATFCTVRVSVNRRVFVTLLRILEALAIKRHHPLLCAQKDHVIALTLPW